MSSTVSTNNTLHLSPNDSRKATKRKIDDALFNLDQALQSTDDIQRPPTKKMRFPGSLYSTLAKYGIKTKSRLNSRSNGNELNFISKTAPHLSAILSRAAFKKEKESQREELARASAANLSRTTSQLTPVEYRPSSTVSFLSRLSTFKLSTYSTKPSSIDAVAASKAGWINEGKERLLCGVCKASWVLASRDGLSRDSANALIEKQRVALIQSHKEGCPWRAQQCDDSIYCIPLKSPSVLAKEVKSSALELDDKKVLEGVEIRHPLASSQVQALLSALSSVRYPQAPASDATEPSTEVQATQGESAPAEPSQKAALTAVFGWSLVPPSSIPSLTDSHPSTLSIAPATSISHGSVLSNGPRRMSLNTSSISEAGSPRPSRIPVPRTSSTITTRLHRQEIAKRRDETVLHCALCQRRVGLWAFKSNDDSVLPASPSPGSPLSSTPMNATPSSDAASNVPSVPSSDRSSRLPVRRVSQGTMPKRQFDLLKEHRSYCPYVVRSTVVPSLSMLANSMSPPRSVSGSYAVHASRPTPIRSSSASSFSFSFTTRDAPQYPERDSTGTFSDLAAVEGWRAVLTMIMRAGLGRRQRQRALMNVQGARASSDTVRSEAESGGAPMSPARTDHEQSTDAMEIDGIHAMVEDVKKRGGKDLLRYVKSLFN